MLDFGLSLTSPWFFASDGGEPPEEDGLILTDAGGNVLADAENNRLVIRRLTCGQFTTGLED